MKLPQTNLNLLSLSHNIEIQQKYYTIQISQENRISIFPQKISVNDAANKKSGDCFKQSSFRFS